MARLLYAVISSLDGYVADADGNFDWAAPDEEVHRFVNELERPVGTYLLGRRMYEVMAYWDSPSAVEGQPPVVREFAELWLAAEKVVYSSTLATVSAAKTRLERTFDPEAVRMMKDTATHDITVSGPHLAAEAMRHALVDECHLLLLPVIVGAGIHSLPDDQRLNLDLLDEHRFANGTVHLHYRFTA